MDERPRHAPLTQFPVVDDVLVVGGQAVPQLADRIGGTPFYAYDREAITQRVHQAREALPDGISLHYAVKANPMPALVDHLATLVDGLDVASAGELRRALDSGTAAADISFAGPGKRDDELRSAVAAGITLNLESPGELARVVRIGEALGQVPQVAVRVNPDFELRASGMRMGGGARPFGIDAEQVPQVIAEALAAGVHLRGLQIFAGSQNLHAQHLIEAQDATFALAYRLATLVPQGIELLNIGGGFGVPYFPGDRPLDLAAVGDNLAERLREARGRLGEVEVVVELGRYLVAEAGVYVCRVLDRKVSRGTTFLVTDGGMHHHLAASGNLGQLIRKNFPLVTAHQVAQGPRETVNVVGPLCTPLDILAERAELGRAEVGDLLVVLQSGAYGLSASPQGFLGHPSPIEVLL